MMSIHSIVYTSICMAIGITTAQPYADIDCVTVTSGAFGTGESRANCQALGTEFVMTGCGWWSPWYSTRESYIDTSNGYSECVADASTGKAQAVAQCCPIGAYLECQTVSASSSASSVAATATAQCSSAFPFLNPDFIDVVGCVSIGEACADATSCDTAVSNGNALITTHVCTAHEQYYTSTNVEVQAVCCQQISDEGTMECQQIIGNASSTANDDESTISCQNTLGSEWFLTSCNAYTETKVERPKLDGHFALGSGTPANDVCQAENSGYNGKTRAVAQCCRIETRADPTPEPTAKPTESPTPAPTDNPTKRPTNDPTKSPTPAPTDAPSRSPTMDGCDFDLDTYLSECYCETLQVGLHLGSAHNDGGNGIGAVSNKLDELEFRFYQFTQKYSNDRNVAGHDDHDKILMLLAVSVVSNCVLLIAMLCGCGYAYKRFQRDDKSSYAYSTDDERKSFK